MNEKTLLILGGSGNTGRPLTRLILQETNATVVLAGRNLQNAENLAVEYNRVFQGERVSAIYANASDRSSLEGAFQGADMVVVASSTAQYAREVASTALAAGIDYLDIQYSTKKVAALKSLATEIESAGRCFITDGGFHPGLPAALVRYAAMSFDSLEKAMVGSVIKEDWLSLDLADETVYELIQEFNDFAMLVFKEGRWQKIGLLGTQAYQRMDFGREFGQQYCAPMFLEEMSALPGMFPSLKETGFFVGGFNWFTDWLVMPLAMLGLKIWPHGAVKPMGKLMLWALRAFSRPPYGTLLKIEAQGIQDAKAKQLHITLYHPDGYLFTAIPVAACLLQYLDGSIKKPGLWTQANLVEPARLMQDMQRMGIEIWRSDGDT